MQIISPVPLRKLQIYCLKGTFMGEAETSVRSSFAGLEAKDSIWAYLIPLPLHRSYKFNMTYLYTSLLLSATTLYFIAN